MNLGYLNYVHATLNKILFFFYDFFPHVRKILNPKHKS